MNIDNNFLIVIARGLNLIAVAIASGHLLIYNDKNLVDHFKVILFNAIFVLKHNYIKKYIACNNHKTFPQDSKD